MKTKAMKDQATTGLVPKLRFPEFRGAKGWEHQLVGPYLEDCSGRVPPDTKLPVYSSTREGLKRQDAYFDGQVLQNKSEYGVVPPACIVYRHMSDDGVFKFNINETGGDIAVSKEYPVFSTRGLNPFFLLAKLNDGLDFKRFALSRKAGGTRTRLYFSRLCEWRTLLPSPAEQQKVADCLGSLDELIAAQGRKVEALKTHKRGLMQRLFPREGETQPRLRFPEFHEAADWATEPFGEVFDTTSGGTPSRSNSAYWNGDIPWVTTTQVDFGVITAAEEFISQSGLKNSSAKVFPKGTVLIAMYGQGKTRGQVAMLGIDAATNQACAAVLPSKKVDPRFVFFNLSARYEELRRLSNSGGQENLSQGLIRELPFSYPEEVAEQQRIANCLSSIDALITAATQALDTLKTHKQGLMQKLFPSVEALEA